MENDTELLEEMKALEKIMAENKIEEREERRQKQKFEAANVVKSLKLETKSDKLGKSLKAGDKDTLEVSALYYEQKKVKQEIMHGKLDDTESDSYINIDSKKVESQVNEEDTDKQEDEILKIRDSVKSIKKERKRQSSKSDCVNKMKTKSVDVPKQTEIVNVVRTQHGTCVPEGIHAVKNLQKYSPFKTDRTESIGHVNVTPVKMEVQTGDQSLKSEAAKHLIQLEIGKLQKKVEDKSKENLSEEIQETKRDSYVPTQVKELSKPLIFASKTASLAAVPEIQQEKSVVTDHLSVKKITSQGDTGELEVKRVPELEIKVKSGETFKDRLNIFAVDFEKDPSIEESKNSRGSDSVDHVQILSDFHVDKNEKETISAEKESVSACSKSTDIGKISPDSEKSTEMKATS